MAKTNEPPKDLVLKIELNGAVHPAKLTTARLVTWHMVEVWHSSFGGLYGGHFGPGRVEYDLTNLRRRSQCDALPIELTEARLGPATSPEIRSAIAAIEAEIRADREERSRRADLRTALLTAERALLKAACDSDGVLEAAEAYRKAYEAAKAEGV